MEAMGYVGEENAKLLGYLIGISRKLPKPLSGIVISQSGVGKSTLTDIIEQLTPPEEVMVFTRITPQALVYMAQEELKGKLLIVEERVGAEAAEYSIRILQSRQELTQAVPLKDPATGKITTQIIRVEGPGGVSRDDHRPKNKPRERHPLL
jgi:DNA primase